MARRAVLLVWCLVALSLAGCGSDQPTARSEGPSSAPASETGTSPSEAGAVDGLFDVGGHRLFLSCRGTGSPTVVYLHGAITEEGVDPQVNGAAFRDLLTDDYRVCLYDRRNVGRSDTVDAVQKPSDAIADLEGLLSAAEVDPPYVLVGASFGGLLSYIYANEHPDDVVGMVLLAAMFPDELSLEHLFPPADRLKAVMREQEADSIERMSQYRGLAEAQPYVGEEPAIPVVYLEPEDQGYDDNPFGSAAYRRQVSGVLAGYVDRFSPGVLEKVDAPHFMETVIPDQIADAVRRVVAESGG